MKPPTKFELMRRNRKKADARSRDAYYAESSIGSRGLQTLAAAVPAMEIDGVKYREAPETNGCDGCAFDAYCSTDIRAIAMAAFGRSCASCIYIKAE